MTWGDRRSSDALERSETLRSSARPLAAYFVVVDVLALMWGGLVVVRSAPTAHQIAVLVLVVAVALVFEEVATRVTRLQLRLSGALKRDMLSVWAVAGAVALQHGREVVLLVTVLVYVWFRQQRPAGESLYRKVFTGATELTGCLCAATAVDHVQHASSHLPFTLSGAVVVVVAMVVYSAVNRGLVTMGLVLFGVRGRALLGTQDANLIEIATLCLGGLVALAILDEPWLVVLALVPMVTLQRGAVVRELETVATTDPKTGLLNAVALEHLGQREVERAERGSGALAVLIVDIDHFKRVNDRFGHLVGDMVLRRVGQALAGAVRDYDTVGRFGGEEFVALLPGAAEHEAMAVAERLRRAVETAHLVDLLPHPDGAPTRSASAIDATLSVSIGVSRFGIDGVTMSDLLFNADTALYRAKANGRNRVVLADRGHGRAVSDSSSSS